MHIIHCLRLGPGTIRTIHSAHTVLEVAGIEKWFILYATIEYTIYIISRLRHSMYSIIGYKQGQ